MKTFEQLGIPCESSNPGPNDQFRGATERVVKDCDTVLALITPGWATAQNRFGFSLLYDPNDAVRRELEIALEAHRRVIPVLMGAATMPEAGHIPGSLAAMTQMKPITLRDEPHFDNDLQNLIATINPGAAKAVRQSTLASAQHHVFISYSRKDTPVMQRIRDDLRENGLSVWVDEDGLEPGTPDWESAVSKAIRGTACLVAILSPDAEQSTWVARELAMAEVLEKRIFPVVARGSEKDAIPFRLMSHQWLDARQDYGEALEKLLGALRKYLG